MKTIEYKVSYEKMISRLPGLFAYLESDEFGNMSLHKATDSLDGCWGKIVENITLPSGVNLKDYLVSGQTYSYRTIIDYYYQYREELGEDDEFVKFIEKAIGKITVEFDGQTEMTPKFIYLANAKKLYNELMKMSKQCEFYERNKDEFGTDKHMCCLCERYTNIGGDSFRDYVGSLIPQAESLAEEYFGYANVGMTLDFNIDLTSTYQDFGIISPYVPIWIPGKVYLVGDKVQYGGELYVCTRRNSGKWDDDLLTIIFDDNNFTKIEENVFDSTLYTLPYDISGETDSKLTDLRRFVTYYNDDNVAERPENGYDWLFYYRRGEVVNIKTVNNWLGNIVKLSDLQNTNIDKDDLASCEDKNDLAAYGDIIYDITPNADERTITFTYIMGVHLKSQNNRTIVYDDDNNKLIKWGKFVWDENENIGIKYQETYNYEEGSDLDKLIKGEFTIEGVNQAFTFDEYIDGAYDKKIPTYKFEFITYNNIYNYDKTIAHQDVNIVSILTDFNVKRNNFEDYTQSDFYREDYLNGITYQPKKKIDVHIERGTTSVFDKHIAFGEIKTMDDMETYKNGSFFRMSVG